MTYINNSYNFIKQFTFFIHKLSFHNINYICKLITNYSCHSGCFICDKIYFAIRVYLWNILIFKFPFLVVRKQLIFYFSFIININNNIENVMSRRIYLPT